MARGWAVTAAVLGILHALASFLGATGMGMGADRMDPMSTGEATGIVLLIALMAAAMFGTSIVLIAAGKAWPLAGVAVGSLAISAYMLLRLGAEPDFYQIPVGFAVLPAAVLLVLGIGLRRRAVRPSPARCAA